MADGDSTFGDRSDDSREVEFLRLFAKSQRGLHAYILALVFDPNTAADLLQETNIVLWRKFDLYEQGTNFFAWAREIARLSVLRHRRTSSRRIATLDPHLLEELAERFSECPEPTGRDKEVLSGCLEKLKDADRELIVARYRPGASVAGIAVRLGRPENSVSQSLCRIRRALAECVERTLRAEERTPAS
jgi:RNA polymerase sigma-70 factor (ECF subfamily)